MVPISEHCYGVGKSAMVELTSEQSSVLHCETRTCESFFRLFKDGEIFHSAIYKDNSHRNDTVCCFQQHNSIYYGEIMLFVQKPVPVTLINVLHPMEESLTDKAGNPCREALIPYKDENILGNYCILINSYESSLVSIDIRNIKGKCVLIETDSIKCLVIQPNKYERH